MLRRPLIYLLPIVVILLVLSGCSAFDPSLTATASVTASLPPPALSRTKVPSATYSPAIGAGSTASATIQPSQPSATATVDPYFQWSIPYLENRSYGGGRMEIVEILAETSFFTRYLVRYPSDGLEIYGFVNVPAQDGPLPVVIAIHGYIDPAIYNTLDYTTRYADDLARRGFLVIHPNLRNYPPSDSGENLFRVGMAVDILNLLAIVREGSAISGNVLEKSDPERIGLWGHSMGGGISTRVMTINQDIRAVVLYAAMSGDERQNFEAILEWSDGERGLEELAVVESALDQISPEYFFDRVAAAVSIHHGLSDELVPVQWSRNTCELLAAEAVEVECTYYPGQPHTFWGENDLMFMENAASFFQAHLGER